MKHTAGPAYRTGRSRRARRNAAPPPRPFAGAVPLPTLPGAGVLLGFTCGHVHRLDRDRASTIRLAYFTHTAQPIPGWCWACCKELPITLVLNWGLGA